MIVRLGAVTLLERGSPMTLSRKNLLLGTAFAASLAAAPASAGIFTLDQGNSAITGGGGVGPYVSVDVVLNNATQATVTFDSLTNGGNTYFMLDGGTVALNVNGAFTLATIAGTMAPGANPATYSDGGAGQEDGFGTFNLTVNSNDGWAHRSAELVLTIDATGGNTWSNADDVLIPNGSDQLAAAHVGYKEGTTTGYVSGYWTPVPVPEPLSLALLGIGVLGIAMSRRLL
jgi:PEP-CTERM motif-containing protein